MSTKIIIAILIIIIAIAAYLYSVSKKQDALLGTISSTEVVEKNENQMSEGLPEGEVVVLTKTSAGLVQPGAASDPFVVDTENTFITFTGFKVGGEHTGTFETMQAEIVVKDGSIQGGLITIDATSVKTDTAAVDTHLQSADFFDAEEYPTITFLARAITFNDADQSATLRGSMTLHGVTQELSIPLTILSNGLAADFKISMKNFGIEFPATKDEVRIQAQVVLK